MPAPKPADMEDCSPKLRCTQGDYVGVAYDPADPCEEGQTFNIETCSCDPFEFCDCSCDNDCAECEICDEATGTCVPDPACGTFGKRFKFTWVWNYGFSGLGNCSDSLGRPCPEPSDLNPEPIQECIVDMSDYGYPDSVSFTGFIQHGRASTYSEGRYACTTCPYQVPLTSSRPTTGLDIITYNDIYGWNRTVSTDTQFVDATHDEVLYGGRMAMLWATFSTPDGAVAAALAGSSSGGISCCYGDRVFTDLTVEVLED